SDLHLIRLDVAEAFTLREFDKAQKIFNEPLPQRRVAGVWRPAAILSPVAHKAVALQLDQLRAIWSHEPHSRCLRLVQDAELRGLVLQLQALKAFKHRIECRLLDGSRVATTNELPVDAVMRCCER